MPKSIAPLALTEYRALVAGIPLSCASAIFTVAGQTFTAAQATAYIDGVLTAVAVGLGSIRAAGRQQARSSPHPFSPFTLHIPIRTTHRALALASQCPSTSRVAE